MCNILDTMQKPVASNTCMSSGFEFLYYTVEESVYMRYCEVLNQILFSSVTNDAVAGMHSGLGCNMNPANECMLEFPDLSRLEKYGTLTF